MFRVFLLTKSCLITCIPSQIKDLIMASAGDGATSQNGSQQKKALISGITGQVGRDNLYYTFIKEYSLLLYY